MPQTELSQPNCCSQVNSVKNAVRILELFSSCQEDALSLTRISRELNLHKTTVYRILRTLQSLGWMNQSSASGRYSLGSRILLVSSALARNRTSRQLILEGMHSLAAQFDETVILAAMRGNSGVSLEIIRSSHALSMSGETGYPVPLGVGATGKTLLAYQPEEVISEFISTLPPDSAASLQSTVAMVRSQGWCITQGEVDFGVTAVAVPLILPDGDIYTLTISGPTQRIEQLGCDRLRSALLFTSADIKNRVAGARQ